MTKNWDTLYPRDDIETLSPYKDKLDAALDDPHITNIAVTGPYDTGKSTFLLSYFKQREGEKHPVIARYNTLIDKINKIKQKYIFSSNTYKKSKDYEFINLPNFFQNDEDENKGKNQLDRNIEQGIVKQLLYSEDPKHFPYSRINRLKVISPIKILAIDILILITMFVPPFNIYSKHFNIVSGIIFTLFLLLISFGLAHLVSKLQISTKIKAPIGDAAITATTDNKEDTDLFSYFGDELQYYFQKSKTRIVIFEDIDRFNRPLIFQKLYELNKNLNKRGTKIVFIYTLRSSVFSNDSDTDDFYENKPAEQKSKFFDYIIPIFPMHSFDNSRKTWDKMLKHCKLIKENERYYRPSSELINNLGLYITDSREIISIASEYDIYTQKLPKKLFKKKGTSSKLLAAIVYKNVYPKDFENILIGKSKLGYILQHKNTLYESVVKYSNQNTMEEINELGDSDEDRSKELQKLASKNKEKIERLSLADIFEEIYKDNNLIDYLKSHFGEEAINFITQNNIIRNLLSEGYLDNSFYDFISPNSYKGINPEEVDFIRNIQSKIYLNTPVTVEHYDQVFKELNDIDPDWYFAYSPEILVCLWKRKNINALEQIIEHARQENDYQLLIYVISKNKEELSNDSLISSIFNNWSDIILMKDKSGSELRYQDQSVIYEYILDCFEFNTKNSSMIFEFWKENGILERAFFKTYLNTSRGSIQQLYKIAKDYKFKDLVAFKDKKEPNRLRRQNLEYIIKNNYYEESASNFSAIVGYFHNLTDFFENIEDYNIDTKFINSKLNNYVQSIKINKFTDLKQYVTYASEHELNNFPSIALDQYLNVVLDLSVSDQEKINFLNSIKFNSLLTEDNIDKIRRLLETDKLPYDFEIWKSLSEIDGDKYEALTKDYFIKYETTATIDDIFGQQRNWHLLMKCLSSSKFPNYFVTKIESDNYKWTIDYCDEKAQRFLIKYSKKIETFKLLIKSEILTDDMKDALLLRIFSEFKGQFTKEEISQFYFDDENYINSWKINGRQNIPVSNKEQQRMRQRWCNVVKKFGVAAKNKPKIMTTKLNTFFKN